MKVVWRAVAVDGLEAARSYFAAVDPRAAESVFDSILGAVGRLRDLPRMGRPGRVAGTRELVVPGTPFIVAYVVESHGIEILAVLHAARRWPDRF